jgi:hypothetical protein
MSTPIRRFWFPFLLSSSVFVACTREAREVVAPARAVDSASLLNPVCQRGGSLVEEEVLGCIHNAAPGEWRVHLEPVAGAAQPSYFLADMDVDLNADYQNGGAQFGWFGMGSTYGPCVSSSDVSQNGPELHGGGAHEQHCINPGRFELTLSNGSTTVRTWLVDWGSFQFSADGHALDGCLGCAPIQDVGGQYDVFVDYDGATAPQESVGVDVAFGRSIGDNRWRPAPADNNGTYHIPSNYFFRVSVTGALTPVRGYLGTFLWRLDPYVQAYSNVYADNYIGHQGQLSQGIHGLTASVLRPTGDTLSRQVSLSMDSALVAVATAIPATADTGVSVHFDASTSTGAATYRWSLVGGGTLQDWSVAATMNRSFHASGNPVVRLEARTAYGIIDTTSVGIHITTPVPPPPPFDSVAILSLYSPPNGQVHAYETCGWEANPYGGSGDFSYEWRLAGGKVWGSTAIFHMQVISSFTLRLTVIDNVSGVTRSTTKWIGVINNGGIMCGN